MAAMNAAQAVNKMDDLEELPPDAARDLGVQVQSIAKVLGKGDLAAGTRA